MANYTKVYLEYCEMMGTRPNERDQIIFMTGYNLRGLEDACREEDSPLKED